MKKILVSVGILAVITGFCWWTAWRVNRLCASSAALLDAAETQVLLGDYPGAEETAEEAYRLWQGHEEFFGMALRHTESDDVGILFPPLQESIRQKNAGNSCSEPESLRQRSVIWGAWSSHICLIFSKVIPHKCVCGL